MSSSTTGSSEFPGHPLLEGVREWLNIEEGRERNNVNTYEMPQAIAQAISTLLASQSQNGNRQDPAMPSGDFIGLLNST